jgi:hypothetical protein
VQPAALGAPAMTRKPRPYGRGSLKCVPERGRKEKKMNKAFLEQLKKAIEEHIDEDGPKFNEAAADLKATPRQLVGISKDFNVNFDGNGNAAFSFSQYCPINIDASAYITGLDAVFDVHIDTNYPQHFSWGGIRQGQTVTCTLKTNVFSSTGVNISIHSSVPNKSATIHLNATL